MMVVCTTVAVQAQQKPAIPRDAALEAKIEKTLAKMTLDEKIGQMLELNLDVMGNMKVENAKIEKETIGGIEFQKIVKPAGKGGGIISHMTAPLKPEGNISIEVQGYELNDPVIAAMLKSFKLKPAEPEAK